MTELKTFLIFLNQEKVSNIKWYKNFQNLDCIIGTATSLRHIGSLMWKIKKMNYLSKQMMSGHNTEWGILSFEDFECHLFTDDKRQYYDLDTLWREHDK